MDKDKLKKTFHSLFNKINNICVAAGANKRILQDKGTAKFSREELKLAVEAFSRIEENAQILSKSLEEFYRLLTKEQDAAKSDSPGLKI